MEKKPIGNLRVVVGKAYPVGVLESALLYLETRIELQYICQEPKSSLSLMKHDLCVRQKRKKRL